MSTPTIASRAMITARGLVQTFHTGRGRGARDVRAVDHVDLDVEEGEVVAFLGPNGAGKTTTLRMLTTLLRPTAGSATVAGHDVATSPVEVRRRIGYVSQAGSTGSMARAGEEVMDHGRLYGMSAPAARARAEQLFADLELDGLWERQPRAMSGGQRRRLDIAMGLVHEPSLVFLDEPTTGLDPQARANLWEHIAALRTSRGVTVFLTTHYLDEADALADKVMVIDHGRIVAADSPAALKADIAGDLVDLELTEEHHVATVACMLERLVDAADGEVEVEGRHVRGRLRRSGRHIQGLMRDLDRAGVELSQVEVRRPTLDDVFLTLTGRSLRD